MPTVQGKVLKPDGTPDSSAKIWLDLVAADPDIGWVTASDTEITGRALLRPDVTGVWTAPSVVSSASITPDDTVYSVKVEFGNGGSETYYIEVPNTEGPFWVGDILTTDPTTTNLNPYPFINAKSYATGDGVTNDTSRLQAAITTARGGTCYIPAGTYMVSGLVIAYTATVVLDPGATIKLIDGTNAGAPLIRINAADTLLRGGTLDGNRANNASAGPGIVIGTVDRITIDDVTIKNAATFGIVGLDTNDSAVTDCRISNTTNAGMFFEATTADRSGLLISGTTVDRSAEGTGVTASAINIFGTLSTWVYSDIRVVGNRIVMPATPVSSAATGITVRACGQVAITSNTIRNGTIGVSLDTTTDATVAGNAVYNASVIGIEMALATYCVVSGNTIDGNGQTSVRGITCTNTSPTHNVISGNNIRRCGSHSIYLVSAHYTTVTGNHIDASAAVNCLYATTATYLTIGANNLYGNGTATKAIILENSYRASVSGNTCHNFTQNGVYVVANTAITVDNIAVTGNVFVACNVGLSTSISGGAVLGGGTTGLTAYGNVGTSGDYLDFVNNVRSLTSSGTPEAAVTAGIGSVYHNRSGGAATSFWVKESGAGNTGWVAK